MYNISEKPAKIRQAKKHKTKIGKQRSQLSLFVGDMFRHSVNIYLEDLKPLRFQFSPNCFINSIFFQNLRSFSFSKSGKSVLKFTWKHKESGILKIANYKANVQQRKQRTE